MTKHSLQLPFPRTSVAHGFREPPDLEAVTGNEPLLLELVASRAFQRLKHIRFLGAIDYCQIPRPNGQPGVTRFSRYEHSLGVMQLARQYCAAHDLSALDRSLISAGALLHDIGHPPLSHSIEPLFREVLGLDHHQASKDIICGRVPLGKEVFSILTRHSVDVESLIAMTSGQEKGFHGFFSGPINFDTIEGILRCHNYHRRTPAAHNPTAVLKAAIARKERSERDVVDEFWRLKNLMYKNFINSEDGILSDYACNLYLRQNINALTRELYFGTEKRLFSLHPTLRTHLTRGTYKHFVLDQITTPLYFTDRSYFVDPAGDFFSWQDNARYRHTRSKRILEIEKAQEAVAEASTAGGSGDYAA